MAVRPACNHDVDDLDATASTFYVDSEALAAWGLKGLSADEVEEITYCFTCKEVLSCIIRCRTCGASWLDGTFEGCPWCGGEVGRIERDAKERSRT